MSTASGGAAIAPPSSTASSALPGAVSSSRVRGEYTLERHQWVVAPHDEVFSFFSRAENLGKITPQWLGFEILTPTPIEMRRGTVIDYRIRFAGLPMKWRSLIAEWTPGESFVDTQEIGPYRLREHTHRFYPMGGGTLVTDRVRYRLPFGILGRTAHALMVRANLASIFDHRQRVIAERFGGAP